MVEVQQRPRMLSSDTAFQSFLIQIIGYLALTIQHTAEPFLSRLVQVVFLPLLLVGSLTAHDFRDVPLRRELHITTADLVDGSGAVAHELTSDEDGHLHFQPDFHHLERAGVPVAHQVVRQPQICVAGAIAVHLVERHASGLRRIDIVRVEWCVRATVRARDVAQGHEPVIQHVQSDSALAAVVRDHLDTSRTFCVAFSNSLRASLPSGR